MFTSILTGILAVVSLCWAMGAYNRMIRLRVAAVQALKVLRSLRQKLNAEFAMRAHSEQPAIDRFKMEVEYQLQSDAYEVAVTQYNDAIAQIPAAWLATLFGFKSVRKKEGKY